MAFYPYLTPTAKSRAMTDVFLGYRRQIRIPAGEQGSAGGALAFYYMRNLSGENYPLLSTRKKRAQFAEILGVPQGILAKDALAWVDGSTLWFGGLPTGLNDLSVPMIQTQGLIPTEAISGTYWVDGGGVTRRCVESYTTGGGTLNNWVETSYPHKQLVSMGAYLCVFPDKKYINTHDLNDFGSMEAHWDAGDSVVVTYTLAAENGEAISPTVSSDPPANPANGDYWVDTSGSFDVLNRYSAVSGEWAQVPSAAVRIAASGIGASFAVNDVIELAGISGGEGRVAEQMEALNGAHQILAKADDGSWIVVTGILESTRTQTGGVTAARTVPDMDFVCEAGNRLWGCYYGLKNGEAVNELYACALGDFRNWNRYEGLSTDAWAASCGTDGQWTGAVNYFGSPTFFKEEHIHVISISAAGAHSVTDYAFEGVGKGCWESLKVVGSTLYYKSPRHVCAYQGGMPAVVSDDLGELLDYTEAAGGAWGNLYYLSMRGTTMWNSSAGDDNWGWHLFVYDSARGLWHREDELHVISFAAADGDLYALTLRMGIDGASAASDITAMRGTQGAVEEELDGWSCMTGPMTLEYPDQKYVTRLDLRCGGTGEMTLRVLYSGVYTGELEQGYTIRLDDGGGARNRTIPVRLHRADAVKLEMSGTGDFLLVSIARILEQGSDYNR